MHRIYTTALLAVSAVATAIAAAGNPPDVQLAIDSSGILGIVNVNGPTLTDGPFFQSLGSNGRSCASCHVASQAMGLSAAAARARFAASGGSDPLFAPV